MPTQHQFGTHHSHGHLTKTGNLLLRRLYTRRLLYSSLSDALPFARPCVTSTNLGAPRLQLLYAFAGNL